MLRRRLGFSERWAWRGAFEITLWGPCGEIRRYRVANHITDAGIQLTQDLWAGTAAEGFKYIAVGTDPTPAADGDTRLGAEVAGTRKQMSFESTFGELLGTVFYLDSEANVHIREIGLFGGASATLDPNSGILVARAIVDINKTDQESLTITRRDYLRRVAP
ncbi:MAG: hypothetical protein HPY55_06530 [Firmicutes bacterium]|nr:hypothetical protein [Bacillota bacterium]